MMVKLPSLEKAWIPVDESTKEPIEDTRRSIEYLDQNAKEHLAKILVDACSAIHSESLKIIIHKGKYPQNSTNQISNLADRALASAHAEFIDGFANLGEISSLLTQVFLPS